MKCFACGYDDEKSPFFVIIRNHSVRKIADGERPFIELYGLSDVVKRGRLVIRNALPLYACPNCGTVRMDNGC
jgi:hypothetical protein